MLGPLGSRRDPVLTQAANVLLSLISRQEHEA
jgi:hypothetical protein